MSKTHWVGRILIAVIALALLTAVGYTLYQIGYARGAAIARAGEGFEARFPGRFRLPQEKLDEGPMWFRGRSGLPHPSFDPRSGFSSHLLGARSFFSLIALILKVAFAGLILWLLYKIVSMIFRGKGWQLTFRSQSTHTDPTDADPSDENEG